jgi:GTP-binding protein Era
VTETTRCGYVALVGRPNVGKSTLLNHLIGRKLAITSRKPQTTRHNLLGILTEGASQALFVDTPGIHEPGSHAMNRYLVRTATSVMQDVDVLVVVVERTRLTAEDELVLSHARSAGGHRVCAINKVDQLDDPTVLLPKIAALDKLALFEDIVPVSALKGHNLDRLKQVIFSKLPEGPHLYPPDFVTDRSERFMAAEIVREKLMRQVGDELPYRATVAIDRFRDEQEPYEIDATIYVERDGQKAIVIGKGGARLKSIGQEARTDIEELLGKHVMLRLWVKVRPGWTADEAQLRRLGYD